MNISKIFKKKTASTPNLVEAWEYKLHLQSDEQLIRQLTPIGSKRLTQIAKQVRNIEHKKQKEKEALERRLKPYFEARSKIDTAISETIKKIRELPEESVIAEGLMQLKTLQSLLAEMEKNDCQLNKLGSDVTYSYRSSDVPLKNLNAALHFISRIREGKIFR